MSSARSNQSSSEISNSYNQSVTATLGSNSLNFSPQISSKGGTGGAGGGGYSVGDISNFSNAFNSADVYSYVLNTGAGGNATGTPSITQSGGGGALDAITKWVPWVVGLVALFVIFRAFKR